MSHLIGAILEFLFETLLDRICGPLGCRVIRFVTSGKTRPDPKSILTWLLGLAVLVGLVSMVIWIIVKLVRLGFP